MSPARSRAHHELAQKLDLARRERGLSTRALADALACDPRSIRRYLSGDRRPDIVTSTGWYEQPAKGSTQETWTFHPEVFGGRGGAEMAVYDVNGDGLNDIVTALDAHPNDPAAVHLVTSRRSSK